MAKLRVKVVGTGKESDPFRVNLPTYQMISGTEEYADPGKKVLASVEVLVPDDLLDDEGHLSEAMIRAKYKGQPKWDRDGVLEGVV